MHSEGQSR